MRRLATPYKDKDNKVICVGDKLLTDEAGWVGTVRLSIGSYILEDEQGGFSLQPNWEKCKILPVV